MFLVAALIVEPRAVIDVALLLVPTLWLWAAPGRHSALGFGLYQLVFLVLNFVQWQSFDFGSREHRALSGHLTFRIVALAAVVLGYRAMKRARVSNSIAREAPPQAGRPRSETASEPAPAIAPEQREIEPSSQDNASPPRRVGLTEGSPSEVTAGMASAPEANGVPHVASAPAKAAYAAPPTRRRLGRALGAIGAVALLTGGGVLLYAHLRKVPACELEREAGGVPLANACYAAHAASREDPGLCDAIESEPSYNAKRGGEVGREGCLRGVAKAAGKPALCGQVRSDRDTAECLREQRTGVV